MSDVYRIKRLMFHTRRESPDTWEAQGIIGWYWTNGSWWWTEHLRGQCSSVQEGMERCEEDYRERLMAALEPAQ